PVDDDHTMLHAAVTFRVRLPGRLVEALVLPVANRIFAQDKAVLAAQAATVRRFGGEHFASTELDVLGQHIGRMLRRAERGEADDDLPPERRFTMRV
ncbi:MAG: aromatic ring-hydroxylating dioxygenase subunit alpha, partial [Actinomycetota bacterium]|nr:aromatic ring-hydroxylating dioxygenase subunit alpha [Actinomycetota bacterium]